MHDRFCYSQFLQLATEVRTLNLKVMISIFLGWMGNYMVEVCPLRCIRPFTTEWIRSGLEPKQRSLIVIALLAFQGREKEVSAGAIFTLY